MGSPAGRADGAPWGRRPPRKVPGRACVLRDQGRGWSGSSSLLPWSSFPLTGCAGPTSQASCRGKEALAFRLVRPPSRSDGRFPPSGTRRAPQNHGPPQEQKHCSCCSPRGELSAGSLLLSVRPQGYLKGPWGLGSDPPGGGGGRRRGLCSRSFPSFALQGFASNSGKQGDSFGASPDFVCCY